MAVYPVQSIDDPRISPYCNLKDRELARQGNLFIAEGEHLVQRLLASDYPTDSVLLSTRRADEITPLVPADVPVYVAPDELMHQIIGYKFHSGIIAVGRRKPSLPLEKIIPLDRPRFTLVICPEIANAENMGSIIRLCAGFGVDGLILGERCCDPFFRQSVRVSMGTIFRLPLLHSDNLMRDMTRLKQEWNIQLAATVLADDAEPLTGASRPDRFALLFGNEAQGLDPQFIAACDRKLTIPMKMGTDSLNVSIAAGIFLYHFS